MKKSQLAVRIDARIKKGVHRVCKSRGLKMNRFVEDALLTRLEELEDLEDLKEVRLENSRLFSDLLRDLKLDVDI